MDDGIIKLNSLNYSTWKRMMEDLLYCKDLYKPFLDEVYESVRGDDEVDATVLPYPDMSSVFNHM